MRYFFIEVEFRYCEEAGDACTIPLDLVGFVHQMEKMILVVWVIFMAIVMANVPRKIQLRKYVDIRQF